MTDSLKNTQISIFMTIHPVWEPSCSIWVDRQTDMMRQIVAFYNFANVPKNDISKFWPEIKNKIKSSIMAVNMLRMKNCVCVCNSHGSRCLYTYTE